MSDKIFIVAIVLMLVIIGLIVVALVLVLKNDTNIIRCPDCKYYYAPVCTFHKRLHMTSRKGYCYHAVKGEYEGETPTVEGEEDER